MTELYEVLSILALGGFIAFCLMAILNHSLKD